MKIAVWLFIAAWASAYAWYYPLENFLWTCNVAIVVLAVALVRDKDRLLLSICLILVALPDLGWTLDVISAALTGEHFIGGTEYVFNSEIPLLVRLFSFEHVLMTPLLLYLLWPLGYDPRALRVAIGMVLCLYYFCYFFASPENSVNWVWGLFGQTQTIFPPLLYPLLAATLIVTVLIIPTHLLARRFLKPR